MGVHSEKGKEVAGIRQDRPWPSKTPLQMVGPTLPPNNADTGDGHRSTPYGNSHYGLWTTVPRLCLHHSRGGFVGALGSCRSGQAVSSPAVLFLLRLQTGWSVHTYQTEKQRRSQCLSPAELEVILQVIQRAERLDILEQQRIG